MTVSEETMKQFGYLGQTATPGVVSLQSSALAITEHDHQPHLHARLHFEFQSPKKAEQTLEARVEKENLTNTFNNETKTMCLLYSLFMCCSLFTPIAGLLT